MGRGDSLLSPENERPSEALLRAVRRRWRALEMGAARAPREGFAPAAAVARAVGALVIDAATSGAGAAAPGAAAGTADGVGRTVEAALARLVHDAVPVRPGAATGAAPAVSVRPAARRTEGGWHVRPRLPPAGWWVRMEANAGGDAGAVWPAVPHVPAHAEPRARHGSGASCERQLTEAAWRALEREIEPASRRIVRGAR